MSDGISDANRCSECGEFYDAAERLRGELEEAKNMCALLAIENGQLKIENRLMRDALATIDQALRFANAAGAKIY